MRTFKYVGDQPQITAFDILFVQGEPVQVDDAFKAGKLAGNRFFKEEDPTIETVTFTETPKRGRKAKAE